MLRFPSIICFKLGSAFFSNYFDPSRLSTNTGGNQIYSETYECKLILKEKQEVFIVGIRYKLTNIEEQCIKEDKSFVNLYWVDDNGFVWQSNQRLKNKIFAFLTIIKPLKKP